jgi:hypothetical protein
MFVLESWRFGRSSQYGSGVHDNREKSSTHTTASRPSVRRLRQKDMRQSLHDPAPEKVDDLLRHLKENESQRTEITGSIN